MKRILEIWNIAADSVIFVDDSPMELAEVAAAHPGIECVLFPKEDSVACLADASPSARSLRQRARFRPTITLRLAAFARVLHSASRRQAGRRLRAF